MLAPLAGAFLLLAATRSALAQGVNNPFVGCFLYAPGQTSVDNNVVPGTSVAGDSGGEPACISSCAAMGYHYSYYAPGDTANDVPESCLCSNSGPRVYDMDVSPSPTGGCDTADNPNEYITRWVASSFQLLACFEDTPSGGTPQQLGSPGACFEACSGSSRAYVRPMLDNSGNTAGYFECTCTSGASQTTTNCDIGTYFEFTHSAAAAASELYRRSLRDRLSQARRAPIKLCPHDLNACKVAGTTEGYECIDTMSELESCGGCLTGHYGSEAVNATSGIDCSTLPGVKFGAVTCTHGRCESFACNRGWLLVDGACMRA